MKIKSLFILAIFAAAFPLFADIWFMIDGSVTNETVVAIPTRDLHLYTTEGRENALNSELLIYNDKAEEVLRIIRRRSVHLKERSERWFDLKITNISSSTNALTVDVEFPDLANGQILPERFSSFEIKTQLKDFEQTVKIEVDGMAVAEGYICDFSRHANYKKQNTKVDIPYAKKMRFIFTKPTSQLDGESVEKTVIESGSGNVETVSTRSTANLRPFKIDKIRIADMQEKIVFRPFASESLFLPAKITYDEKRQITTLLVATRDLPVQSVALNPENKKYKRNIRVMRKVDEGWRLFRQGEVIDDKPLFWKKTENGKGGRLNFPDAKIDFNGSVLRQPVTMIEIEDLSDPPLKFNELPVELGIEQYDAIFIAQPGRTYHLVIQKGAKEPRYNDMISEQLKKIDEPMRFSYKVDKKWTDDDPEDLLPGKNPIFYVTAGVFIILLGTCIFLLLSKSHPEHT